MMWSPRALIGLPGNWLMKIKNNTGRLAKSLETVSCGVRLPAAVALSACMIRSRECLARVVLGRGVQGSFDSAGRASLTPLRPG
jgi:hypothetical protein